MIKTDDRELDKRLSRIQEGIDIIVSEIYKSGEDLLQEDKVPDELPPLPPKDTAIPSLPATPVIEKQPEKPRRQFFIRKIKGRMPEENEEIILNFLFGDDQKVFDHSYVNGAMYLLLNQRADIVKEHLKEMEKLVSGDKHE